MNVAGGTAYMTWSINNIAPQGWYQCVRSASLWQEVPEGNKPDVWGHIWSQQLPYLHIEATPQGFSLKMANNFASQQLTARKEILQSSSCEPGCRSEINRKTEQNVSIPWFAWQDKTSTAIYINLFEPMKQRLNWGGLCKGFVHALFCSIAIRRIKWFLFIYQGWLVKSRWTIPMLDQLIQNKLWPNRLVFCNTAGIVKVQAQLEPWRAKLHSSKEDLPWIVKLAHGFVIPLSVCQEYFCGASCTLCCNNHSSNETFNVYDDQKSYKTRSIFMNRKFSIYSSFASWLDPESLCWPSSCFRIRITQH